MDNFFFLEEQIKTHFILLLDNFWQLNRTGSSPGITRIHSEENYIFNESNDNVNVNFTCSIRSTIIRLDFGSEKWVIFFIFI